MICLEDFTTHSHPWMSIHSSAVRPPPSAQLPTIFQVHLQLPPPRPRHHIHQIQVSSALGTVRRPSLKPGMMTIIHNAQKQRMMYANGLLPKVHHLSWISPRCQRSAPTARKTAGKFYKP